MASRVHIEETVPRQLLQPASGYLKAYDYTLNPFVGCVFACAYCYVRAMPVARFHTGDWGTYVDRKQISAPSFVRELERARKRGSVRIFMSSSTDPYQPAEHTGNRTRRLLELMTDHRDLVDFLFVQTRSPLVARDIHLLQQFEDDVLVSMTIETDDEEVRKRFTPAAPPLHLRIKALETLHAAGISTQVAVSPVLPCTDSFAQTVRPFANYVVIDDYFMGDGSLGRRTKSLNISDLYNDDERLVWYTPDAYQRVLQQFSTVFEADKISISQTGFLPPRMRQDDY